MGAVALKVVIVGVLGGELGYLSYLGAVALGAWIAGLRGGAAATIICALAQTILFSSTTDRSLTPYVVFNLGLFLLDGALVTILSSRLRRAYVRERSARTTGEADLEAQTALHEAAERDRVALTTLQAVTASLSGARTPVEVGDAILDRGLVALGAAAGGVSRVTDDGASVEVIAVRGYPDSEPGSRVALDHESHLRDAIESGTAACSCPTSTRGWRGTRTARPRAVPGVPAGGAIAVLPMIAGSRTLGAIVFRFAARPRLRRRHARPGDPAGRPGRPGARPRARVGRRPAVARGARARSGTARVPRPGERRPGLRDRHRRGDRGPARR